MKKLILILILLLPFGVSADAGSSYVLKIEICTIDDDTIIGYVKTNDYFIDRYLNNEKTEPFKDFIIRTVHFTREPEKFTYFENSVNYKLEPKVNVSVGYDLDQLQLEKNISTKLIKSISITEKKKERNHLNVVSNLDADNQFWLSKEPIKTLNIGCPNEWCCNTVIIYSADKEIRQKIEQYEIKPTENLYDFFLKKIDAGQEIVIIECCTE